MRRRSTIARQRKASTSSSQKQGQRKVSSSILYRCIDYRSDSGEVSKQVVWADEFIEIVCNQPKTHRHRVFYISCGVITALVQRYSTELAKFWDMIVRTVMYYEDRVLFSTDYLLCCPTVLDSTGRPAQKIYEVSQPTPLRISSQLIHMLRRTNI